MVKPRLLIIGHARHGKDTVATMIAEKMKLRFSSSSYFVGRKAIWEQWGKERYDSFDDMFIDRVNHRTLWHNLISAYCTPNKCRTAEEMFALGNDMYVGMRNIDEYQACMDKCLFDHIIWVDASKREPIENTESNHLTGEHSDMVIDNNGPESNLEKQILELQELLDLEGFDVNYQKPNDNLIIEPGGIAPEEFQEPKIENRLSWLDKPANAITVLDHGFFEVKGVFGDDADIAESARMSYGRGTKKVNNDEGLINYLVRNYHTSPLEMAEIKFHMRLPIFVMRQMVRHRTANLNEYSGRYSQMVRLFYVPELDKIMYQSNGPNKQMSGAQIPPTEAEIARQIIKTASNESFDNYELLLEQNVSRETARIVLPLNTYTECVWKMDISNLIKFLYLRDDDHAQWEIRVYAKLIGEAVERFFPLVYAAYLRERQSLKLTPLQIESLIRGKVLEGMSKSESAQVTDILKKYND